MGKCLNVRCRIESLDQDRLDSFCLFCQLQIFPGQQSSSLSYYNVGQNTFCQSYLFFLGVKFWLTFPSDALQYEITLNYYVKIAVSGSTNIYYSIPSLILTINNQYH